MHIIRYVLAWLVVLLFTQAAFSQMNRITYNNQQLFLSGANLAWVSFANDIGSPTPPDTTTFGNILLQMHNHGGNTVRWWLHTNGTVTPAFDGSGYVSGPGTRTIADLKKVLDLAWEREIGVDLCLWSFDMLKKSNDSTVLSQNTFLLNDTNYTRAYINNCLIPMVDSLKGHPTILAWEIFNEPEGMSNEFGWGDVNHVPMSSIQRFVNLCAGAIHRTDTAALVTSGAWSFYALCDNALAKSNIKLSKLSSAERLQIGTALKQKYRSSLTPDEILNHLEKITAGPNQNYYRDDRLLAAGGDPDGLLDFYSVHYYSTSTPVSTSPFNHLAVSFGLNKPIVVGEFATDGTGKPSTATIYDTLYHLGYAGALAWSFTDPAFSSASSMLAEMQLLWNTHRSDVDINGIAFSWPSITITNPSTNASYPDSTGLTFWVAVSDTLQISSVAFYADTAKIGEVVTPYGTSSDTSFYWFRWNDIPPGNYSITAVAINSGGHQKVSNIVQLSVGKPPMMKLEAETATRQGPGMTVKSDNTASNHSYVDIRAYDADGVITITWQLNNVPAAGTYEIAFGYMLPYASPKSQYINLNGVRFDTIEFTGASAATWYEKSMYVDLVQGINTIQMEMHNGWMYLDYLAVPVSIATSVVNSSSFPTSYSLSQNYPNPFNPATTIRYSLPHSEYVKLFVYDVLGRKIAALVDKKQDAGVYETPFNASLLPSGVYFYRLNIGTFTQTKKMIILK